MNKLSKRTSSDDFEEDLEKIYWHFDAAKKGEGSYKNQPLSERDAFKLTIRELVTKHCNIDTFGRMTYVL